MIRRPATVDPNSRFAGTSANSKRQAPGKRNGRKNGWKLQASLRSCQNVESLGFESSIRTVNRCPFPEITCISPEVSGLFFQTVRGELAVKSPSPSVLLDRYHASPREAESGADAHACLFEREAMAPRPDAATPSLRE